MLRNTVEIVMIASRSARWMFFASAVVLVFGCNTNSIPDAPKAGPGTAAKVSTPAPKVDEPTLLTVTPQAAVVITEIKAGMKKDGHTGPLYLRLRALPGGCSGFMHKLELDSESSASTDYVCESGGVKVVVWKSQVEMLRGTIVDHGEKDGRIGFIVKSPNFEGEDAKKWMAKLAASVPESERPKPAPLAPIGERITQFRKMTAEDPENELGHYRLGQLLMEDGQFAEAVKSFERTLELSPKFSRVYQSLGECFIKLDRKDRAIEVLTKGRTIADQEGDETDRDAMAKLLKDIGAAVPTK